MKKIILSVCLTVFTVAAAMAQLTVGHVVYSVDVTTDNPEMEMVISMMQGTTLEIFFNGDLTRTDVEMGTMMSISTVVDAESGDILMLMGGMMGDKAIITNADELEALSAEDDTPDMELELYPKVKSRTIQGYKCKKATLTDEDGVELVFWYTEDVKVNTTGQNYLNDQIPGFPMEFEQVSNGMNMKFTVTTFDKKLGKEESEIFSMDVPEGYEEMTMEQLQSMGM
jgi:GLPGLI family protein